MNIDDNYWVVVGVPIEYQPKDSAELMHLENQNMDKFISTGKKYGPIVAYQLLHEVLPGMKEGSLDALGNIIYKYRFEYGSIDNCSFAYPPIINIANKLRLLYSNKDVAILSLSSVGPAFFAVTKNPEKCVQVFESNGLKCIKTKINNEGYKVIYKKI